MIKHKEVISIRKDIVFSATAVLIAVLSFTFLREQDRLISLLKEKLKEGLYKRTGATITIGKIDRNPFKKIVLEGIDCRKGSYRLIFRKARLNYSLWDIISKRVSLEKGVGNRIELRNGSFSVGDKRPICRNINSRVNFLDGRIIIEGLSFVFLDSFSGHIKGIVYKRNNVFRSKTSIAVKRLLDKDILFSFKSHMDIKKYPDRLDFYSILERQGVARVFTDGNYDFSNGVLRIRSHIIKDIGRGEADQKTAFLDGELDTKSRFFRIATNPLGGRIIVNGDYSKWPIVTAQITNDHIKIYDLDFSNIMHLNSRFEIVEGDLLNIKLDAYTESTVINYYPFDESEISCILDKDVFRLTYLKIGEGALASGVMSLKDYPSIIFLKTTFRGFDISRLAFICRDDISSPSGSLSGELTLEGDFNKFKIEASLLANDGYLGSLDYKNILLNLKGEFPVLTIYDSRLVSEDSSLTLNGHVDLRRIGNSRFLEDVVIETGTEGFLWDGWNITNSGDTNNLHLKKGLKGGINIGFKKYIGREVDYEPLKKQDELELEYKMLDKNSFLQLKTKENEEFLGVMKKYKF